MQQVIKYLSELVRVKVSVPLTEYLPRYHSQYNLRVNYNKVCVRLHGCCLGYVRVLVVKRGSQKKLSAGDLPDEDDFRRSGAGYGMWTPAT